MRTLAIIVAACLVSAAAADETPPDASAPVIPVNCTIDVTSWNPKFPKYKIVGTYRVSDGNVSGTAKLTNWPPAGSNMSNYKEKMWFEGTIEDNHISGIWHGRTSYEIVSDAFTTVCNSREKTVIQCELLIDGTLKETAVNTMVVTHTFKNVSEGAELPPATQHKSGPDKIPMTGTWKLGPFK